MKYRRFGNTGLEVSQLCLGCMSFGSPDAKRGWVLEEEEARPIFRRAWEQGITFFDTADIYGFGTSEEITGKLLAELAPREEYVLASKLFMRMRPGPNGAGLGRNAIFAQVDASLKRLNTDYIDLYQIHRYDPFTPLEETLQALDDVVRSGKVRYIGASSMFAYQLCKALFTSQMKGWRRFISMQCQLNLLMREEEREMLPLCAEEGIAVMPWSPLGGGKLTRPWGTRTKRVETDMAPNMYAAEDVAGQQIVAAVASVAEAQGVPMAQVALAWVLGHASNPVPIIGASSLRHVDDAVAALELALDADQIAALEAPYRPLPMPRYITAENIVARGRLAEAKQRSL